MAKRFDRRNKLLLDLGNEDSDEDETTGASHRAVAHAWSSSTSSSEDESTAPKPTTCEVNPTQAPISRGQARVGGDSNPYSVIDSRVAGASAPLGSIDDVDDGPPAGSTSSTDLEVQQRNDTSSDDCEEENQRNAECPPVPVADAHQYDGGGSDGDAPRVVAENAEQGAPHHPLPAAPLDSITPENAAQDATAAAIDTSAVLPDFPQHSWWAAVRSGGSVLLVEDPSTISDPHNASETFGNFVKLRLPPTIAMMNDEQVYMDGQVEYSTMTHLELQSLLRETTEELLNLKESWNTMHWDDVSHDELCRIEREYETKLNDAKAQLDSERRLRTMMEAALQRKDESAELLRNELAGVNAQLAAMRNKHKSSEGSGDKMMSKQVQTVPTTTTTTTVEKRRPTQQRHCATNTALVSSMCNSTQTTLSKRIVVCEQCTETGPPQVVTKKEVARRLTMSTEAQTIVVATACVATNSQEQSKVRSIGVSAASRVAPLEPPVKPQTVSRTTSPQRSPMSQKPAAAIISSPVQWVHCSDEIVQCNFSERVAVCDVSCEARESVDHHDHHHLHGDTSIVEATIGKSSEPKLSDVVSQAYRLLNNVRDVCAGLKLCRHTTNSCGHRGYDDDSSPQPRSQSPGSTMKQLEWMAANPAPSARDYDSMPRARSHHLSSEDDEETVRCQLLRPIALLGFAARHLESLHNSSTVRANPPAATSGTSVGPRRDETPPSPRASFYPQPQPPPSTGRRGGLERSASFTQTESFSATDEELRLRRQLKDLKKKWREAQDTFKEAFSCMQDENNRLREVMQRQQSSQGRASSTAVGQQRTPVSAPRGHHSQQQQH